MPEPLDSRALDHLPPQRASLGSTTQQPWQAPQVFAPLRLANHEIQDRYTAAGALYAGLRLDRLERRDGRVAFVENEDDARIANGAGTAVYYGESAIAGAVDGYAFSAATQRIGDELAEFEKNEREHAEAAARRPGTSISNQ